MAEKLPSAATLKKLADAYFERSAGEPLLDEEGKQVLNRGSPVVTGSYPLTMAGLACALGMTREELKNFSGDEQRTRVIEKAKARVEAYAEAALFESGSAAGAKFALSHNFDSWDEAKPKQKSAGELSDEELKKRIDELENA